MTDEKPVRFWLSGAGGAPGKHDMRFLLSPLPPPGLLTFFLNAADADRTGVPVRCLLQMAAEGDDLALRRLGNRFSARYTWTRARSTSESSHQDQRLHHLLRHARVGISGDPDGLEPGGLLLANSMPSRASCCDRSHCSDGRPRASAAMTTAIRSAGFTIDPR
jgi:hypothetical protein